MSLTLPSAYTSASKQGNIQENWFVQLGHTDFPSTATNFLGLAITDTTVGSVFYHGAILNTPVIRESLNLLKSTANTGNIKLEVANFTYKGSDLSQELVFGTRYYLNRTVKIYSQLNGDSTLANCLQLFNGKIQDIQHDNNKIIINIIEYAPWDNVTIPQTKSSDKNIYFPIAYGDFTPNATARDYRAIKTVRPMPVNEFRGTQLYSLIGIADVTSNAYPHYYDKSLDRFIPVSEDGSYNFDTNSDSYKGGFAVQAHYELEKRITFKPVETTSSTGWTNPDNAFDDADANEATNYTNADFTQSDAGTSTKTIKFKMPQIEGKVTAVSMEISYTTTRIVSISSGTPTVTFTLTNKTWGANDAFFNLAITSAGTTSSSITTDASASLLTQFNAQGGWGDEIEIEAKVVGSGVGSYSGQFQPRIYDVRILATTEVDWDEATNKARQTANKIVSDIDTLYTGGDGLTADTWGSAAAITEIHEAHRDLLYRFAGVASTTPTNWSSLDGAKDWKIRWWTLDTDDLRSVCEKLQFEGGFIHRFRHDGGSHYLFIPDGSISATHTFTKDDINNILVSHTPLADLNTKIYYEYEKHPARNSYLTAVTATNSTTRTNYIRDLAGSASAKENINTVKLDGYTSPTIPATPASNPNDDIYTYYDNISGTVKLNVSATIVNPAFYNVEIGDFIAFDNDNMTPDKAFGSAWTGKVFIITQLTRSPGSIAFKAREVYSS